MANQIIDKALAYLGNFVQNAKVQWGNTTDVYWWSNTWTAPEDGIIEVAINPSASNWYFYISDSKAPNTGWSHCLSSNSTYRFIASFPVKKGAVLSTSQMQSVNTANVYYTPFSFVTEEN